MTENSTDERLALLDSLIQELRNDLDNHYKAQASEQKIESLWRQLETLSDERDWLLSAWPGKDSPTLFRLLQMIPGVMDVFYELREKLLEFVRQTADALLAIARIHEMSRPKSPREIFAPRAVGISPLSLHSFSLARPPNRRPVLPGYMVQKGRG